MCAPAIVSAPETPLTMSESLRLSDRGARASCDSPLAHRVAPGKRSPRAETKNATSRSEGFISITLIFGGGISLLSGS